MKIMNKCTGEVVGSNPIGRANKTPKGVFCLRDREERSSERDLKRLSIFLRSFALKKYETCTESVRFKIPIGRALFLNYVKI
jgi:hypothetical protein